MLARDIMNRTVLSISPEHSVRHAARTMLENRISSLPVCDDASRLVGMLSESDLLSRAELGSAGRSGLSGVGPTPESFIKEHSWRVGDVMTQPAVTVDESVPIGRIAELMAAKNINRIPVMRAEELVGIVCRSDILRVITAATPDGVAVGDEAVRRAVSTRLCCDLGIDVGAIDVTIENGNVTLSGQVQSEAMRTAARVVAETVSGVGGVRNMLRVAAA
ncbi:CBS domain-containing protein [Sinorhizobium meliloti]|uniref:CBS domain-containing protein n=2 Tax=Rhizobium meliloti TaxID=382 RepID=UPI000FD5E22D|nr:CBS domain-containing protein [Sinorhizobium meliloti]MDW9477142.1 CBS domain-containing protein [Sinorhizobium meliloti]MDW9682396.1 CBS domain-containing protein [Sinorhizobium meliloti]MDW9695850.1 CBS domain-containing protein [Sinorhizobium meliloti]MDW9720692.1 CBS domain-containing protein [Sinorhizobium meliloti]MDW9757920.1 CBS domain-containing protein [Sinorhizobium meliloti]